MCVGAAAGGEDERADCLAHLALAEALRGRPGRAAQLAAGATAVLTPGEQLPPARGPNPAALAALAWVHLERNELRESRGRLKQSDTALVLSPDKLIGAIACLVAACGALAEGCAEVAAQIVARARSGWPVPAWLEQRLSLVESRALVAAGGNARRVLEPAPATRHEAPERAGLQAWLVDAQLSYHSGHRARGHRSLASALRPAERKQLNLPFSLESGRIRPVPEHDPGLDDTHRRPLEPTLRHDQLPARRASQSKPRF